MHLKNTKVTKLESWLSKNKTIIAYGILGLFIITSLLLFSLRLSIAGDDSTYITRALNLIDAGKFPNYQAPLYPMILSVLILIFGIHIPILKLSSLVFMATSMLLLYRTFKDKISYIALFYTLTVLALSNQFIFFSSQTFSEPLFLVFSVLFICFTFQWIDIDQPSSWIPNKKELSYSFLVSSLALLMFLTRTVGIGAIISITAYLLFTKQYRRAVWSILSFGILLLIYTSIRDLIWDIPKANHEQALQLLSVNPYKIAEGKESIGGFIKRFVDNSNLYLSKHFLKIIGLRSERYNTILPMATILIYALFIWTLIKNWKENKYLLFTGIYLSVMLGITFISLQKLWDQSRLIIPFVPFMIMFISHAFLSLFETKGLLKAKRIAPYILGLSIILNALTSYKHIDLDNLSKNFNGDIYAGFTPDWISYLEAVNHVSKELPEHSYVACRKPNIARIYANGKKFYGIYRIPSDDPIELAQILKEKGVSYVIMGSLRKNPAQFTGKSINTIQRCLGIIARPYPKAISVVAKFGDQEPSYIFKINYDAILANE